MPDLKAGVSHGDVQELERLQLNDRSNKKILLLLQKHTYQKF